MVTQLTTNPPVKGLSKRRSDGIPSSPLPMVVCGNTLSGEHYVLLQKDLELERESIVFLRCIVPGAYTYWNGGY